MLSWKLVGWRANARGSWMESGGGSLGVLGKSVNTNCGYEASKNRLVEPPSSTASISTLAAHRGHQPTKASCCAFR